MESNTAIDLSEIEQIVKEKTEQHEENSKSRKPNFDLTAASETNGRGAEYDPRLSNNSPDHNDKDNSGKSIESALRKRDFSLNELIDTEKRYVEHLGIVVNGYMAEMNDPNSEITLPEDLRDGKGRLVFGNIEYIYEWHRDYFLKALQYCREHPNELGKTIKRYDAKFGMYNIYTRNKKMSEYIVNENTEYFDKVRIKIEKSRPISNQTCFTSLYLPDLLIAPVQRLAKYEVVLKEILSHTEKAGMRKEAESIKDALHIMKSIVKTVNDMMELKRLQKFEGNIAAQGTLLLHGVLSCYEDNRNATDRNAAILLKQRDMQVFLFQQSVIFADIVGKKTQFNLPNYIYRSHILVNKMKLEELPNNRFLLISTDPHRPEVRMICSAGTIEENREWLNKIHDMFKMQNDFLMAVTKPKLEQTQKQQLDDK